VPQERSNEKEPLPGRYFSGPADKFNGFHGDGEHPAAVDNVQYRDDRQPVSLGGDRRPPVFPSDQVPTFLLTASDGRHDADTEPAETGEVYGADDYYVDVPDPRRRDGLIVVAVLALAVLGTAGTFAYRAMFGGSALPAASAVTKTGNWPNKIVSNYGDDRRSDSNQTPMASADPSEELVSREEKPLDIHGPKTAPRVISTIPISPNSSAPSLGAPGSAAVAPLGPAPAPAVAPPEPTAESVPLVAATGAPGLPELKKIHTVAIRSDLPDSVGDALATPMVSPLAPAPVPAPGSPEPKKIHTVTIRSDGSGRTNSSVAARNATSERRPSAAAAPPVGNQPMSPTPRDGVRSRMTVGTGTAAEASSAAGRFVDVAALRFRPLGIART